MVRSRRYVSKKTGDVIQYVQCKLCSSGKWARSTQDQKRRWGTTRWAVLKSKPREHDRVNQYRRALYWARKGDYRRALFQLDSSDSGLMPLVRRCRLAL